MSHSKNILMLENVVKKYESAAPDPAGQSPVMIEQTVIDGVDLVLEKGKSLAIVGPSGSGKTTLLNIIGTLDAPTDGKVVLDGRDLAQLDRKDLVDVRSQKIGFIFQAHHLLPHCTVLENVLVPTLACPDEVSRMQAPERAHALLEKVGLADKVNCRPSQLSGGQRQRVAVIRALINQPVIILADEPTGSLDRNCAREVAQLLIDLNRQMDTTLLIATHSSELASMMDRTVLLRDGKLIEEALTR